MYTKLDSILILWNLNYFYLHGWPKIQCRSVLSQRCISPFITVVWHWSNSINFIKILSRYDLNWLDLVTLDNISITLDDLFYPSRQTTKNLNFLVPIEVTSVDEKAILNHRIKEVDLIFILLHKNRKIGYLGYIERIIHE